MAHPLRSWLAAVIDWAKVFDRDAEQVADLIIEQFLKGVTATTPPDGGT